MLPDPLHPILVHFPIAFTLLLLPLAAYGLIASRRSSRRRPWVPVVILASLALATALLARQAGDREEDRVERWVDEIPLEYHEEQAERFLWSLGAVFSCSLLGLAGDRFGRLGQALTVVALLPATVFLVLAGQSGGDLVYKHGAASAYADSSGQRIQRAVDHSDND